MEKKRSVGIFELVILICFTFIITPTASVSAEDTGFVQAKLYYYGWYVDTEVPLTPDEVRENPMIETVINDSHIISNLLQILGLSNLKESEVLNDPRLVIDLYKTDGTVTSYYASYDQLYSEDLSLSRDTKQGFRDKFDYFKTTE